MGLDSGNHFLLRASAVSKYIDSVSRGASSKNRSEELGLKSSASTQEQEEQFINHLSSDKNIKAQKPIAVSFPEKNNIKANLNLNNDLIQQETNFSRIKDYKTASVNVKGPSEVAIVDSTKAKPESPIIVYSERSNYSQSDNFKVDGELVNIISSISEDNKIDPALSLAIVRVESDFRSNAVSKDGYATKGLFQLRDSTGKEIREKYFPNLDYQPFNPAFNTMVATKHLNHLFDIYKKPTKINNSLTTVPVTNAANIEKFVVAAFNAGEGRVTSAQKYAQLSGLDAADFISVSQFLPKSTQGYVQKVINSKQKYN